jgi:hypothetical protein
MKDGKSLLLLLLAFGLVGTWIFHLYDKNQYSNKIKEVIVKDTAGMAEAIRDSLEKLYATSVNEMGDNIDTASAALPDSLQGIPTSWLRDFIKLRKEVEKILSTKNITKESLQDAQGRIQGLRAKLDDLTLAHISPENKRKLLTAELGQLHEEMSNLHLPVSGDDSLHNEPKKTASADVSLTATDVKMTVMNSNNDDESEAETSTAKNANKLVLSFTVRNTDMPFSNAEIFVVITNPEGAVITNEIWDSGSFDTRKETGKTFTRKIKFDYVKGEKKRIVVSLGYDKFTSGTYQIKLYHNKMLIGQTKKTLS